MIDYNQNGSGKTTFLNILAGYLKNYKGKGRMLKLIRGDSRKNICGNTAKNIAKTSIK